VEDNWISFKNKGTQQHDNSLQICLHHAEDAELAAWQTLADTLAALNVKKETP
jgi:hypothetical protein